MNILTIDAKDFLKGMSSSNYVNDGGFSPDSTGIESHRSPSSYGLLKKGRDFTEYSTNLVDAVVASFIYGYDCYSIGNAGKVYKTNIPSPSHTLKATDSAKTYNVYSDIIVYKGDLYITSTTDVCYNSGLSSWSLVNNWWTNTKGKSALNSGYNHKFIEFNGILFFTDKNKLHSWNGTTATEGALVLPSDWVITDVAVLQNYLYISVIVGNSENPYYTKTKIIIWDTIIGSNRWNEEIELNIPPIRAIKEFNGQLYIFAQDLYLLNGRAYSLLRYSVGYLANWKKIATTNHNLYFVTSNNLIGCYNILYGAYSEPAGQSNINVFFISYADYFHIFTSNNKFYRAALNNLTGVMFKSNNFKFSQPVNIRKIEILFNSSLSSNASYDSLIYDDNSVEIHSKTISHNNDGSIFKKVYIVNILSVLSFSYGIRFNHANCADVKSINIYYEPSERTTTKSSNY